MPKLPWFLSSLVEVLCADAAGAMTARHTARAVKIAKRFMLLLFSRMQVCVAPTRTRASQLLGTKKRQHGGFTSFDAHTFPEVGCSPIDRKKGKIMHFLSGCSLHRPHPGINFLRLPMLSNAEDAHAHRHPGSDETR